MTYCRRGYQPTLAELARYATGREALRFELLEAREMLSGSPLYALNVGGPTIQVDGLTWMSDAEVISGVTNNFTAAYAHDTDNTTSGNDTSDPSVSLTGRSNALLDQSALTLSPQDYLAPDAVFQSWRYDHRGGENLRYGFAVSPGKYRVDLYFTEPSKDAIGERVFDIRLEGATVLSSFDIYAETGAGATAVGRSFVVESDSTLDVELVNQTGVAILQAIRVSNASSDIDRSFNPSTFTAVNINLIQAGDVVELQPGTYRLSQADLEALLDNANAQRNNITLRGVPGQSILDFRMQSDTEWIEFDKWVQGHNNHYVGMTFDGLTFLNAGILVNRGHGFVLRNSVFDGYEGKTHEANDRVVSVWYTDNAVVENNYIRWNNTTRNINALAVGQGIGDYIVGNKIEGLLRKAVQLWKATDGVLENNDIERWADTPGSGVGGEGLYTEDHGYYIHDSSYVQILSNTARGWSDTAAGNSVKIKNVNHVEVADNEFYTSGIIGRISDSGIGAHFEHVWIHNNIIHDGGISVWTPDVNPTAVRIDSNTVLNGGISAVRDVIPELFNQSVGLGGGLPGGVYDNMAVNFNLAAGINTSGNITLGTTAAAGAESSGPAVFLLAGDSGGTERQVGLTAIGPAPIHQSVEATALAFELLYAVAPQPGDGDDDEKEESRCLAKPSQTRIAASDRAMVHAHTHVLGCTVGAAGFGRQFSG